MWGQDYDAGGFGDEETDTPDAETLVRLSGVLAAQRGADQGADGAAAAALPPPEQVADFLSALVQRDGAEAVMRALMQAVPGRRVMSIAVDLCARQFGTEPSLISDGDQDVENSAPRLLLASAPAAAGGGSALAPPPLLFVRCWHCEPWRGERDSDCLAMRTLAGLAEELDEQSQKVDEEEEFGEAHVGARRAARYYMYRKFVFTQWGYLGPGRRVRIPKCVVEYIRDKFRQPGCNCQMGGELYACRAHGYTGHVRAKRPRDNE
mmetsp:Transcript_17556/g.52511  ORF Transcript_17556/g.52511 Transcript_17556/m.52511 type:complete len:264 (-) Transcript_17556:64-855(-)